MLAQSRNKVSREKYLASERLSETRHEFFDGDIFAMAGASKRHNQICSNLARILGNQLSGRPCNVYVSDMRVKSEALKKYSYPDLAVACEEESFEDEQEDTLLNPTLLIEVLSDSTEAYDREEKFFHYRQIASFSEYILVSQKNLRLERFLRQPDETWLYSEFHSPDDKIDFISIGCAVTLEEIYEKVKLEKSK